MYECFNCRSESVTWDGNYDFSDFGYEGEGIVRCYHCDNCGARIKYRIKSDEQFTEE